MVEAMGEGSLVIDMAADGGGNCELTKVGEVVEHHGVRVVGCRTAGGDGGKREFHVREQRFEVARAVRAKGQLAPDWNDEVVIGVTVARDGAINHAPTAEHWPRARRDRPEAKESA